MGPDSGRRTDPLSSLVGGCTPLWSVIKLVIYGANMSYIVQLSCWQFVRALHRFRLSLPGVRPRAGRPALFKTRPPSFGLQQRPMIRISLRSAGELGRKVIIGPGTPYLVLADLETLGTVLEKNRLTLRQPRPDP